MSLSTDHRPLTARIGTYYAIFLSSVAALVLLLLILEQLGVRILWISHAILIVPVLIYLGIAAAARTLDVGEFFAAGRRVPPVFGGLALAIAGFGGVGLFALTGAVYLIGFDALSIAIGWAAGLLAAGVMIVPYLRKAGAYTVPGFLRQRFGDPVLGAVASALLIPPAAILLAAELRLGAFVASLFGAVPFHTALAAGACVTAAIAALGGLRSVTWAQCAQYAVALAGFVLPLIVVSVLITGLPVPPLTYGALLEPLASQEAAAGLAGEGIALPLTQVLSGDRPQASLTAFASAFTVLSRTEFVLLALVVLAGTAAMPSLLMRAGTSPSVFAARHSLAWGLLFLGLFLVSVPAYAAFAKYLILQETAGVGAGQLPAWADTLREAGLADFSTEAGAPVTAADLRVARDGLTVALPIVGDFPFIVAALVAAGGIAATLAAATAHAAAIGNSVSEDMLRGWLHPRASPGRRLLTARAGMAAATGVAAFYVAGIDFDVLHAAVWAMSLAASAFLPALVLSIWWRRATASGVLAGMLAGFGAAAAHIVLAGEGTLFGLSGLLAGALGVPVGAATLAIVSLRMPPPAPQLDMLLDEIRDPGGRALLDRRDAQGPRPM